VLEAVVRLPLEVVLVRVDLRVHLHLDEVRRFPAHGTHLQQIGRTASPLVTEILAEVVSSVKTFAELRSTPLPAAARRPGSHRTRRLPGVVVGVYDDSER
jgi:hypothetical protein